MEKIGNKKYDAIGTLSISIPRFAKSLRHLSSRTFWVIQKIKSFTYMILLKIIKRCAELINGFWCLSRRFQKAWILETNCIWQKWQTLLLTGRSAVRALQNHLHSCKHDYYFVLQSGAMLSTLGSDKASKSEQEATCHPLEARIVVKKFQTARNIVGKANAVGVISWEATSVAPSEA